MIEGAKEVARSPVLNDDINLARLSTLDTVRLMLSKLQKNDMDELENAEKISVEKLKCTGALNSLIEASVNEMNLRHQNSVTLNVSSKFLPYVDEVVDKEVGWGRFYDIEVFKRDIPQSVKHYFIIQVRKKG